MPGSPCDPSVPSTCIWATRTSVAVTPRHVSPPLSPCHAGAHGAAYTDSTWRGGSPNPRGQPRGGGNASGPLSPTAPPATATSSLALRPWPAPAVPLVPRLRVATIDSLL